MKLDIQEEIPCSDILTEYDKSHFTLYLRLLDASADDASDDEMARVILGIDPADEPERAQRTLRTHLDRANWLLTTGYKELFTG